jgi:hypothetical protein
MATNLARRDFLKWSSLATLSWLTPVGHLLAREAEKHSRHEPAQSIILLWMAGGPSQLETFDPHPNTDSAAGSKAIDTAVESVKLGDGFGRLAEEMGSVALVRSLVSKEGDHERGTYLMKTGYRPDPTVVHPSIGAICCHELPAAGTDIPRHVSIVPGMWPGRGGFLGDEFDAFKTGDPAQKVTDITPQVSAERDLQRIKNLDVVEQAFAHGRKSRVDMTLHRQTLQNARAMMTSEQLRAFDVNREPARVREMYGDTPFGRGCLAARRLIEVGVRCVEVTLDGWDTHANNHELVKGRVSVLDPAFSALIRDLKEHHLLHKTVVLCAGEFGRTPNVNRLGGRDHWTNGYSVALAGGGIRGGQALGATDPDGAKDPANPVAVADIHATVLTAVGIDPAKIVQSPIGRTLKWSEGRSIPQLLG